MSTYYADAEVSTCQIAGAIAAAALHDLRVNSFTFGHFPQILIVEPAEQTFSVEMSVSVKDHKALACFELTRQEAFAAAKLFNKTKGTTFDSAIFKRVQNALIELEGQISGWEWSLRTAPLPSR